MKKKIVALATAVSMMSSMIPMFSITAGASPQIDEMGYTDITQDIAPQILETYGVSGDAGALIDSDTGTGITITRNASPWIGGFVLDAGDGNTFASVDAIDCTCSNGDDLYIFGSNDNIQEAIQTKQDEGVTDFCGSNYDKFNEDTLGIPVTLISTAEVGFYQDSDGIYWGRNITNDLDYRYLYIGTPRYNARTVINEMKLMHAPAGTVTVNTSENCEVSYPETFNAGDEVTITVTADEGYEPSKLNINGETVGLTASDDVDGKKTAEYTIESAPAVISADAWADPSEGRLYMTALTEKPEVLGDDVRFGTLPAAWSDNDTTGRYDFLSYGGLAVFDAEAGDGEPGDRYKIDSIIAYAGQDMPGRAHFKVFGTNDELTADMFTAADGANSGSEKLTALTHGDNDNPFLGTGAYTDNSSGGRDSVRGEYAVNGDTSYRYIIIHSDHRNMMSLSELKFYGSVRGADEPDPTPEPTPEPDRSTEITVNTQENCTVTVPEWYYIGGDVTVTVTANEGYESSKLNINGRTVRLEKDENGTVTCTLTDAPETISVDAWADPTADRIALDTLTAEQLPGVTALGTLPDAWSDGDVTTFADFKPAPGLAVLDAGEGYRYALSKVISYARQDMPGRSHFKIFGTNAEPLTADMFTDANGANGGLVFTELTHDGDAFFGTGSWDNNRGGGTDAVRGEYDIDTDRSYRYIVIQSDHRNMMSLGELKLYGTVRQDGDPNEPEPEKGTAAVGIHSHCTVGPVAEFNEGDSVSITVTANDGYEISKLNLNDMTVKAVISEDGKTASYNLAYAPKKLTIDAWAEKTEGRLEMNSLSEKPEGLDTITSFAAEPAEWSDNDATTTGDIARYPGLIIYDAGEDSKYALSRVVTYANAAYPCRAHFKMYGTNEELTADMFTAENGADAEKLTVLTNDEGDFYGTGSWEGSGGGNGDAVRQYYDVQGGKGYRYIILQSDNTNSLSLSELRFYGEIRDKDAPDPMDPSEITDPRLITYDLPDQVDRNKTYIVKARPAGAGDDEWQTVEVYSVQVMSSNTRWASMAFFDCTGETEIQVTCTGKGTGFDDMENGLNSSTSIYPASYGIVPEFEEGGDVITFTMKPGQRVVLDPNDDSRRNLHIWADYPIDLPAVEELESQGKTVTVVDASEGDNLAESYDTDIVYVKPGFYSEGYKETPHYIKDNQTWYLEPGVVIQGLMNLDYTTNAKLIGRGLMWRPQYASITVNDAVNAHIEGMMGLNHGWADNGGYFINIANSKNIYVKNLKSIGRHKWGDTMDIFCSEDVTVEGCFFRGNDDCIAIYGPRWTGNYWGETGNVRNIKVRNCVLMPDVARPIHLGTHGDSTSPNGGRVIDNCSFEDIDILTYSKYAPGPQPIRMDPSDGNMISNIYFDDIRIQDGKANNICDFYITVQGRYGTNIVNGKGINNVYFKDVQYTNENDFGGKIDGAMNHYNRAMAQNITFENLVINGEVALSAEDAHIALGTRSEGQVRNINFVRSGESEYQYNPEIVPEDIWPEYYDYARADGVTVTASADLAGTGDPGLAIDGSADTVWESDMSTGSSVYNSEDKTVTGEGIMVDLGAQRLINAVRLTWGDPSLRHDYRIYVSKDGTDWSVGHTDEHAVGAVNSKSRAEYNTRVKTTWFMNQYDPKGGSEWIIGQYVKIVPQEGTKLDIASLEILGETSPDQDPAELSSETAAVTAESETAETEEITEIKTAEDLEKFAASVNAGSSYSGKTVTLANDIDLSGIYNESGKSWTPIGLQDSDGYIINAFAGTFDGGGHSIKGLYINNETGREQGLFGIVSGTVKDLTVEGEVTASSAVGGIAGWNYGSIINCTSSVNITARREAGGIAGTLGNNALIEGCTNNGDVTVTNKETYAGGIAGHNNRGTILNCTNSGKIENGSQGGEDAFRNKIGGIVGFLYSGKIENSDNSGEITSHEETASYTTDITDNYIGGIVGYSEGGTITYSDNSGKVNNAVNYAGGIAGYLQNGDSVMYCNNTGEVTSGTYAGGVAGFSRSDISVCENSGNVICGNGFAGGIVGYLSSGVLNNCTYSNNDGLGIAGRNDMGQIITDEDSKPTPPPVSPGTPTETPAPPTGTPEAPTGTPEVPTETPEAPTGTPEAPTESPEPPTESPAPPTEPPTPDPDKVTVYAEDGIIIIATYGEDKTLQKVEFAGEVKANEEVKEIEAGEDQKVLIWNSLDNMKPVATREQAAG